MESGVVQVRFRVRLPDGREYLSGVAEAPGEPPAATPATGAGTGAPGAAVDASGRDPAASPQVLVQRLAEAKRNAEDLLANPRWSGDSFAHGDDATMEVDAPGLDGESVLFRVQHKQGDDWIDWAAQTAVVKDGVASATLQVEHPKPGEAEASPADLRFTCELA